SLFPYTTLFRSLECLVPHIRNRFGDCPCNKNPEDAGDDQRNDRRYDECVVDGFKLLIDRFNIRSNINSTQYLFFIDYRVIEQPRTLIILIYIDEYFFIPRTRRDRFLSQRLV